MSLRRCMLVCLSLVSSLVLGLASSITSVASAQGADFAGAPSMLQSGAVPLYAIMGLLLALGFAIAVAGFLSRRISGESESDD